MSRARKTTAVHVGIQYPEAVQSKRLILETETDLLEIIKNMRNYSLLRKKEFIIKNKIKKSLLEIKTKIKEIEQELPEQEQVQEESGQEIILHKVKEEIQEPKQDIRLIQIREFEEQEKTSKQKRHFEDIETQLEDIKSKLDRLG